MRQLITAAALAALLAACSGKGDPAADASASASEAAAPSSTLSAGIAGAPGMAKMASALKDTGLAPVFDGKAAYTVLAPTDDAFGHLGDAGKTLMEPGQRAALAAVLRAHVLPGYFTPDDIRKAIAAKGGKPVKMPATDGTQLTFAMNGDKLTVSGADGVSAKIDGSPVSAGNGVAIPIDTVLKAAPKG